MLFFNPSASTNPLVISHRKTGYIDSLLTTEAPHPLTAKLSEQAQHQLTTAYQTLADVDAKALEKLKVHEPVILSMAQKILNALQQEQNVFFSGCGSSARAALIARKLFAEAYPQYAQQVHVICGGGDLVVIRAAEGFEDSPEKGIRQLQQAGWTNQDLLITLSASGAAGFVHGQMKHAIDQGAIHKPMLLCCNPSGECQRRFANDSKTLFCKTDANLLPRIAFVELSVDHMVLSGSTRMQAATAQLAAMGFALTHTGQKLTNEKTMSFAGFVSTLQAFLPNIVQLAELTRFETDAYHNHHYVVYTTPATLALNIATDTTERSPTFNSAYFENLHDEPSKQSPSLCRLVVVDYTDNTAALAAMLGRPPQPLNWEGERETSAKYLQGYTLTQGIIKEREQYQPDHSPVTIEIDVVNNKIIFTYPDGTISLPTPELGNQAYMPLALQLALKLALNTHSTLVAGRMGWYQANFMTHVKASNLKLLNRAVGLAYHALRHTDFVALGLPPQGKRLVTVNDVAEALYQILPFVETGQSLVVATQKTILLRYLAVCYLAVLRQGHRMRPKPRGTCLFTPTEFANLLDVAFSIAPNKPIVCIDGGGTYFRFSVLVKGKPVLLEHDGDPSEVIKTAAVNVNVDNDGFCAKLDAALQAIKINGLPLVDYIKQHRPSWVMGIAGMGSQNNQQRLRKHLVFNYHARRQTVCICSDVDAYLAHLDKHGAVLIAGTGSVCVGLTSEGQRLQVGGLGSALGGDPGNATAIGQQALKAFFTLKSAESYLLGNTVFNQSDPLFSQLRSKINELWPDTNINELIYKLNTSPDLAQRIPQLCLFVFEMAFEHENASNLALKIIPLSAFQLARQLTTVMTTMFRQNQSLKHEIFRVIIVGGLFDNEH